MFLDSKSISQKVGEGLHNILIAFGRHHLKYLEVNATMLLKCILQIGQVSVEWIRLADERNKRWTVVYTVTKFSFFKMQENSLLVKGNSTLSKMILLPRICLAIPYPQTCNKKLTLFIRFWANNITFISFILHWF
jgi:hypothetical protein